MLKVTVPTSYATSSLKDDTVVIDCIRGLTPKAEILTWTSFCHDCFRRVLHAALFQPAWDYTLVCVLTTATANSTDDDNTDNADTSRTNNPSP